MSFVLEPCPIPSSICQEKIFDYTAKYMSPRQDFYKETGRSLFIEDEVSEWIVAKASQGQQVGKGNEATDVVTSQKEGIDVMCVIMNGKQSNEKSLIQNFNASGCDLDGLFRTKNDTVAIQLFMGDLKKKLFDVCSKRELSDLYILAFVSLQTTVHLCCFKYNLLLLDSVISSGFSTHAQSINVGNFIDDKWGNVKLYKAKKRVELRLKKACVFDNQYSVKIYELPTSSL